MPTVHLLDYVAGNVRSLVNAIHKAGYDVEWIRSPGDLKTAEVRVYTWHRCPAVSFDHHWLTHGHCRNSSCQVLVTLAIVSLNSRMEGTWSL